MDARRGFPGMWDSSVCASVTTLHVCCSSVYWMIFGGARWGLQRIQFSQCQWMGSRWTRPALLGFPPLASCMPGLARIPSDARRPAPTTTGSVSPRVRQIYPRPLPFVHSLWGCCRRPLNSRCRRHDMIGSVNPDRSTQNLSQVLGGGETTRKPVPRSRMSKQLKPPCLCSPILLAGACCPTGNDHDRGPLHHRHGPEQQVTGSARPDTLGQHLLFSFLWLPCGVTMHCAASDQRWGPRRMGPCQVWNIVR